MSKKYFIQGSALAGPMTPPQSPQLAISPSLSPDLIAKVNAWVTTQSAPSSLESTGNVDSEKKTLIEESSTEISSDRKKVHWTPNILDNEGKTGRNPKPRRIRSGDKAVILSSKSHHRTSRPPVPDPPRSRGPPPTPRPRRLPTPELPEMKCGDFCDCCYTEPITKMNAQLAAAASHIANARQSVRRLT